MEIKGLKDKQLKLYFIRRIQEVVEQENRDLEESEIELKNLELQRKINHTSFLVSYIGTSLSFLGLLCVLFGSGIINVTTFLMVALVFILIYLSLYFAYDRQRTELCNSIIIKKGSNYYNPQELNKEIQYYLDNVDKSWNVTWNNDCKVPSLNVVPSKIKQKMRK